MSSYYMSKVTFYVALVMCCLTGCAATHPVTDKSWYRKPWRTWPICVWPAVPGMETWNAEMDTTVFEPCRPARITWQEHEHLQHKGKRVLGLARCQHDGTYITRCHLQLERGAHISIFVHELGHALGVPHSPVETSVMYWKPRPLSYIRKADRDAVRRPSSLPPRILPQ